MTYRLLLGLTLAAAVLGACKTVPDPEPEAAPVRVEIEPLRTCTPVIELERVFIPAEYITRTRVSVIESAPEYRTNPDTGEVEEYIPKSESIAEPYQVLVKESEEYYVNASGVVVTDICDEGEIAMTQEADEP